jgi:hypothetical protein
MAVRLCPFPAEEAEVVSSWARTREEVIMWCGHPAAPDSGRADQRLGPR